MQTATFTPENLIRWKLPPNYVGARWDGFYRAPVDRNRDSELLTQSNWTIQLRELEKHKADVPDDDIVSPTVVRESHWAVGWVEWVAIHESNTEALKAADAMAEKLGGYPILDEGHASELEQEAYWDEWEGRYVRKEFADGLASIFNLSGLATELLTDADPNAVIEAFESLVPSGEFYTAGGGGVNVNVDIAIRHAERTDSIDRKWMANLLRSVRKDNRDRFSGIIVKVAP